MRKNVQIYFTNYTIKYIINGHKYLIPTIAHPLLRGILQILETMLDASLATELWNVNGKTGSLHVIWNDQWSGEQLCIHIMRVWSFGAQFH